MWVLLSATIGLLGGLVLPWVSKYGLVAAIAWGVFFAVIAVGLSMVARPGGDISSTWIGCNVALFFLLGRTLTYGWGKQTS